MSKKFEPKSKKCVARLLSRSVLDVRMHPSCSPRPILRANVLNVSISDDTVQSNASGIAPHAAPGPPAHAAPAQQTHEVIRKNMVIMGEGHG